MPDPISRSDLQTRLEDPILGPRTLEEYFELKEVGPFRFEYRLREDAPITDLPPEEVMGEVFGPIILGLANRIARNARKRRYEERKRREPDAIRLVSEGDSWFQHPLLKDLVDHLCEGYNILSLGAAGDVLANMVAEAEYRSALSDEGAAVLLWSGGGNDMLGDHFGDYLTSPAPAPGSPPADFVNEKFDAAIGKVISLYESLASDLALTQDGVTLVTHGYDRVIPVARKDGGKWVGPPMEKAGIDLATDGRRVIEHILEVFDQRMRALATTHTNVVYVSTHKIVPDDQWDDEIHPTSDGFGLVAARIRTTLGELLSG